MYDFSEDKFLVLYTKFSPKLFQFFLLIWAEEKISVPIPSQRLLRDGTFLEMAIENHLVIFRGHFMSSIQNLAQSYFFSSIWAEENLFQLHQLFNYRGMTSGGVLIPSQKSYPTYIHETSREVLKRNEVSN